MALKHFLLSFLILIISLVVLVFISLPEDKLRKYHKNLGKTLPDEKFDFIIVGAGTAGSVLANRLTANPNVTVLLLEAGDSDSDLRVRIPAAFAQTFESNLDWGYNSVPQSNKGNNSIFLPRGKVMGGSSSINAMIYIRGSAYDYDEWERQGFSGWGFDHMLKYFKKSEKQMRNKEKINTEYHGFEGEWLIGDTYRHPVSEILVEAFEKQWNLTRVDDFNGDKYQKEGIGFNQVNIAKGERVSLSDAFLNKDVLARENLFIRTNVLVTKILFEGNSAIGIEYEHSINNSSSKRAFANKEVILSAGAYNTPQLLQLSGIGDRKLLEQFNIPVLKDNPEVGMNLQDHPVMGFSETVKEEIETLDKLKQFPYNLFSVLDWLSNKNNALTTNCGEVNGFIRSSYAKAQNDSAPDFQIVGAPAIIIDHGRKVFPVHGGVSYGIILLNPKSKGSVKISSNNPRDHPIIDPNVFAEKEDFDRFFEMIKKLKLIRDFPKLKNILGKEKLIIDMDNITDEEIKKVINEYGYLLYHGCCTTAMGKVVDEKLKVINVNKLRIVDASVMPAVIRGNTNAPTAAIAEKAADMIYEDHNLHFK